MSSIKSGAHLPTAIITQRLGGTEEVGCKLMNLGKHCCWLPHINNRAVIVFFFCSTPAVPASLMTSQRLILWHNSLKLGMCTSTRGLVTPFMWVHVHMFVVYLLKHLISFVLNPLEPATFWCCFTFSSVWESRPDQYEPSQTQTDFHPLNADFQAVHSRVRWGD